MIEGNCLFAQSGGPTSVINSSAYGVITELFRQSDKTTVFAGSHGIQGILDDRLVDISKIDYKNIERLRYLPAAAFGSCRYKLTDYEKDEKDYSRLLEVFKKNNIRNFFYIGGNDSMDSTYKISKYFSDRNYEIKVMGVPKTIDNDLVETDHCPGFGSAAKYIVTTATEIWIDINSYHKDMVMIIEAMGRDAGWLTASANLMRTYMPDVNLLTYLPEQTFNDEKFLSDIENAKKKNRKVLIVASEGLKYKNGQYIFDAINDDRGDMFGHKRLGGCGLKLKDLVSENITKEVKSLELSYSQRCGLHAASKTDHDEAMLAGQMAVRYLDEGHSGYMAAFVRNEGEQYSIRTELSDLSKVRNQVKPVPLDWIEADGTSMTQEFMNYVKPLVKGNVNILNEDGFLDYVPLSIYRA